MRRPFAVTAARPYDAGQHRGVDLAARPGSVVRSACAGRVRFAGRIARSGGVVSVRCGALVATYLELGAVHAVRGRRVGAGARLGVVGPAAHLHLGARDARSGRYVDPLTLLRTPRGPTLGPAPDVAPPPRRPGRRRRGSHRSRSGSRRASPSWRGPGSASSRPGCRSAACWPVTGRGSAPHGRRRARRAARRGAPGDVRRPPRTGRARPCRPASHGRRPGRPRPPHLRAHVAVTRAGMSSLSVQVSVIRQRRCSGAVAGMTSMSGSWDLGALGRRPAAGPRIEPAAPGLPGVQVLAANDDADGHLHRGSYR